jgi:O-methyltransferase
MSHSLASHPAIGLYVELLKKTLTASIYDESAWVSAGSSDSAVQRLVHRQMQSRSLMVVKTKPFDVESRREGRDWPLFGYTMAGHKRLDNVQLCVEDVLARGVAGDFLEAGAWRGGSSIFMRGLLKAHGDTLRRVWVADSFEGLPAPKDAGDGWDYSEIDYLKVSLEQVQRNFEKFGLLDEQVAFLKGWFSDTLPQAPVERLAILRLDADMYSSTMDALTALHHKVSAGGYVIVDDYHSWPACKRAVDEFLAERKLAPEIRRIDWTGAYWQV